MSKKIKKVVDNTAQSTKIMNRTIDKTGKPKLPKHILKINNHLYITCDSHCFKLVEVSDTKNPKTGMRYPDKSFCYAPYLDEMIKILAHNMTREVPYDILELSEKLDKIYKLIERRIPKNISPKDLFKEIEEEE